MIGAASGELVRGDRCPIQVRLPQIGIVENRTGKVGSHEATIENDGTVEVEVEMWGAGQTCVYFSPEQLERLAAMSRAMRAYHAKEARDE